MTGIEYKLHENFPNDDVIEWLANINQEIFAFDETPQVLKELFSGRTRILICSAFLGRNPIGYKIGFEDESGSFESWRGGVLESARRKGVASRLMKMQHSWCRENQFKLIKTTTTSDNNPMLILNLKSGFEIVGTFRNHRNRLKIIQEKVLKT